MTKICEICGLTLASKYSYNRHMMVKHPYNVPDNSTDQNDENDTSSVSSNNSETSEEYDEADHVDTGNRNPFWRTILSVAYSKMDEIPENFDEMKNYKFFNELTDILKGLYEKQKFYDKCLGNSKIENKLNEYKELLSEKGFNDKDADEASWEHLKFLFKGLIDYNKDIFDAELENRDTDE